MSLICFDTHILIWGVQGTAKESQKDMIPVAKEYIENFNDKTDKILVPSLVVAEFSLGLGKNDNISEIMYILTTKFIISSFDLKASDYFRNIWHTNKKRGYIEELQEQKLKRETLKVDMLIIAEAMSTNASMIITYDNGLMKLAEDFIETSHIPTPDKPSKLFPHI